MSIKVVILLTLLVELIWEIYRGDPHKWKSALALCLSFGISAWCGYTYGAMNFEPTTVKATISAMGMMLLLRFGWFDQAYAKGRDYIDGQLGGNFFDRLQTKFINRHKYNKGTLFLIKDTALLIFILL